MTTTNDDYAASALTTGTLAVGGTAVGGFQWPGDVDWFAIHLDAGNSYSIALTIATSWSYYPNMGLGLVDAQGNALVPTVGGHYASPVVSYQPTVTGTYYVVASALSTGIGDAFGAGFYTLSAAIRTGPDDFTANASGAGVLTSGGTASGVFEVIGDRDWFKFHADAGYHYIASAVDSVDSNGTITSVRPDVISFVDAEGLLAQSSARSFDAAVSGDYYLAVGGQQAGNYTVKIQAVADDYPATDAGAGQLSAGGTVSGLAQFAGDDDRFIITLAARTYYTFTIDGGDAALVLRVTGSGIAQVHDTGGGTGKQYTVFASVAGDYRVDAVQSQAAAGAAAVPYTITASPGIADDIGDTPATAVRASVGASAHGQLQSVGDIDVFKVALQAGITYAFSLKSDDGPNTHPLMLNFLASDGTVIDSSPNTMLDYYTVTPAQTGDYYAAVGTYSAPTNNVAYTLAITQPADDVGASAATAGALAVGASVHAVLETGGGDRDWFGVDLAAGTTYWFSASGAASIYSGTDQLRLLDAAGNVLAQTGPHDTQSVNILAYVPDTNGKYFIEMSSPTHFVSAYTLSAAIGERDDYGSTPASAGVLVPGVATAGKLELSTDQDMFKMSVVAGVTYGIDVTLGTGSLVLHLVDAGGAAIDSTTRNVGKGIVFTARASGDAYLTIGGIGASASSYSLKQIVYGVDDAGVGSATTAALAIGASVQGALGYPGDYDSFRVHLESGVHYVFQLLGAASQGGTLTTGQGYFSLTDGNGASLGTSPISGAVETRMGYTPAATGDYYLNVGYAGEAMGSYTIKALQLSGDATRPALLTQSRHDGDMGVGLADTKFAFTFSEPISVDKTAISVTDSAGHLFALRPDNVTVSDNMLSFFLDRNFIPGSYTVTLPHSALHDLAGNAYAGPETFAFTTILPVAAATSGNDLFSGGAGARIDGGAGVDTVVYTTPYSVDVRHVGDTLIVTNFFGNGSFPFTTITDTLVNVERLLINGVATAYDVDGDGGQAYRLYQAAFHRKPDANGIGFWIAQMDKGLSLHDVAQQFVASAEFSALYGSAPDDNAYLTALYSNVLHRAPDAAGLAYWGVAMHNGGSRADVLQQFSESQENQAALVATIGNGFTYTLY